VIDPAHPLAAAPRSTAVRRIRPWFCSGRAFGYFLIITGDYEAFVAARIRWRLTVAAKQLL
jgi:hypothetical protein